MATMHTAHSFRCPTETRELGEAYALIRDADKTLKTFDAYLDHLRASGNATIRAKAQEFYVALGEIRKDAGWANLVAESAAAFDEADVRPIKVSDDSKGIRGDQKKARPLG